MSQRYARQIALADVGAEGQAKLGRARMLVVGLGGRICSAVCETALPPRGTTMPSMMPKLSTGPSGGGAGAAAL